MILYISTYKNSEIIAEAVEKSKQTVMDHMINDRISLTDFVKTRLNQLQSLSHLLIDLQALVDEEKEIIDSIQSLRMVYDDKRIILLDLSRKRGDELLSQFFSMGIYDIISEEDIDIALDEIVYCITTGKKFKDSMQYQLEVTKQEESVIKEKVTEKVIVQNHIIKKLNNALIGIVGTAHRVGASHHVIMAANYLKRQGHNIAVLECSENSVLDSYKEFFFDEENDRDFFEYKKVVYYPNFRFEDISQIFNQGYDVIIIDFGVFKMDILNDFLRCMTKVVVTGSQPYELSYSDKVLGLDDSIIQNLNFVFQDASSEIKKIIRDNMEKENVYFAPYNVDPFHPEENDDMRNLYQEFINVVEKKERKGWLHGLFSKKGKEE